MILNMYLRFRYFIKQKINILAIIYHFIKLIFVSYIKFEDSFEAYIKLSNSHNNRLMLHHLCKNQQCKNALKKCPRLKTPELTELLALSENTLGYSYGKFIEKMKNIPPSFNLNNPKIFAIIHLIETHDLWHIVTGIEPDQVGETKLQAFYLAQIPHSPLPMFIISRNLLKTVLENIEQTQEHIIAIMEGWQLGKQAKPLFGFDWNSKWEITLDEVRHELNINIS